MCLRLQLQFDKRYESVTVDECAVLHERFDTSGQDMYSWVDHAAAANRNNLGQFVAPGWHEA
jgi:hypothetical protein